MESGCYFLKATESPERVQAILSDFYDIVAAFAISPTTGKPDVKLPAGWTMNLRNDIAMAEFVSPSSTGSIKFTVTVLGMPPADQWPSYLLSNINRWRGQLKLPEILENNLQDELISVNRPSSLLPGYIFDAVGTGSGSMTPAPAASPPASPPGPISSTDPKSSADPIQPEWKYEIPDGWQSAPGTPFRLATFKVVSTEGEGEVTVSMAVDNPIGNTTMWFQQVSRESDPDKLRVLAESSIADSETIDASLGRGTLYTIRDSEQVDAPMLLVASVPSDRDDLRIFVKLRGDTKLVEAQRGNLVQFAKSLQLP
jgi:hypothetical protein